MSTLAKTTKHTKPEKAKKTALHAASGSIVSSTPRAPQGALRVTTTHRGVIVTRVRKSSKEVANLDLIARIRAKTTPHDPVSRLNTEKGMAAYLNAALQEGDPRGIAMALGVLARAKGMTQLAKDTGLNRESLYSALGPSGNPEMSTFMKVLKALGLQLQATAAI